MEPKFSDFKFFNWYLKYIGFPLIISTAIYVLFQLVNKKRHASLQGKVVVITGASSGLGEALAHVFYEKGCKVVLAARRKEELERVKKDLQSKNLSIPALDPVVIKLDLTQHDSMEHLVQEIYNMCDNACDILINNASIMRTGLVLRTKLEVFKQVMDVNYFGAVALTNAVLPKMVLNKRGHVVFVSSAVELNTEPKYAGFGASNKAIQSFGDTLRHEVLEHNINVTIVNSGCVRTNLNSNNGGENGDIIGVFEPTSAVQNGLSPRYVAEKILEATIQKLNNVTINTFLGRLTKRPGFNFIGLNVT